MIPIQEFPFSLSFVSLRHLRPTESHLELFHGATRLLGGFRQSGFQSLSAATQNTAITMSTSEPISHPRSPLACPASPAESFESVLACRAEGVSQEAAVSLYGIGRSLQRHP